VNTIPSLPSLHGQPTWEIAQLFPTQGEWTEADYFGLNTNRLVELSDGNLEFLPMPTLAHQMVVALLYRLLFAFVEKNDPSGIVSFAPTWVRLWPGKIREPDLIYLRSDHRSRMHRHVDGADFVAEVVSSNNSRHDRDTKRIEYAQAGIPEYWLIDPLERQIIVYVLDGKDYRQAGIHLAGTTAMSVSLSGWAVAVDDVLKVYDQFDRPESI
jgi:Uma2 family endonuclease